ncbi:MAG TPA: glucose-6-phosphate dehydrogenase, partial [Candidatus Goldiibacteriota bacterium]|nr:glucose-6-phosphate dehydrogenase [Candidatus Goldiibacteriota bacterium]
MDEIKKAGTCVVSRAGPCGLVIFGASGDLARKKLFPSVFKLFRAGQLAPGFFMAGCGRTDMDDGSFKVLVRKAVMEAGLNPQEKEMNDFAARVYYCRVVYGEKDSYAELAGKLKGLHDLYATGGNSVFFLAVPPNVHADIAGNLALSGLAVPGDMPFTRILVEKPFGRDLQSANALNEALSGCCGENQIYRVDHYLGKNTVQNLLVFRFGNSVFEQVWNSGHIESVQVVFSEKGGIEGRAGYFESAGLIRDVFQNHILQLVALVAMEKPAGLTAEAVMAEKEKLISAIRPFETEALENQIIRGQYRGYRNEQGVDKNSCVETF